METQSEKWQDLYPLSQAKWNDLRESGQATSPIVVGILLSTLFSLLLALADPGRFQITNLNLASIMLIVSIIAVPVIGILGLRFVWCSIINYFRLLYKPSAATKAEQLIKLRLLGIPPLPPPLDDLVKSYPVVIVEDAKIKDQFDYLTWLGGPALLVVMDGNALYLNRGNSFSRVLGPGLHFLEKYEIIVDVVDLRQQTYCGEVKAWTKDGISIKFKTQITCRIGKLNGNQDTSSAGPVTKTDDSDKTVENTPIFPCDPVSVRKAVEWTTVKRKPNTNPEVLFASKWLDGVWGKVQGAMANYVSRHRLDELFVSSKTSPSGQILSESERAKLQQRLNSELTRDAGVSLINIQIMDFDLGDQVANKRIMKWLTDWVSQEQIRNATADANLKLAVEEARAVAQRDLIIQIAEGLSLANESTLTESVLLSLSGVLDKSIGDPSMQAYAAHSTLETLEKIQELLKS